MFPAMHPSGPVAHQCARDGISSRVDAVVGPVHGGLSHSSHPSKSLSQYRTTAERVKASASSEATLSAAHSWSDVFVSMPSCSQPRNWGFKGVSL